MEPQPASPALEPAQWVASAPPASPAPFSPEEVAPEPSIPEVAAGTDFADVGGDDFSEFSAPTVMLTADDLAEAGILPDSESTSAEPAAETETEAVPAPVETAPVVPETVPAVPATTPQTTEVAEPVNPAVAAPVAADAPTPLAPTPSVASAPPAVPPAAPTSASEVAAVPGSSDDAVGFGTRAITPEEVAAVRAASSVSPETAEADPLMTQEPAHEVSPPAAPAPALPDPASQGKGGESAGASKTLGELYLKQGHLDKALEIFEQYLAAHPEDQELAARVAGIRAKLDPSSAAATPGTEDPRKKLSNWLSSLKKH